MARLRHLLPSFNALVTFEAAVRCGTFARAAEELCVTGPAVSRTIARLEAHLGVALFRRTSAGAVLTAEGTALHSGISASFDEIEKTLLRVRRAQRPRLQTIVLSASSAFATHWFMPRLAEFRQRFPRVDIRFQLISGPLQGPVAGVDIAMRFDHGDSARHMARALAPEMLVAVRAPGFSGAEAPSDAFGPALDRIINPGDADADWSGLFRDAALDGGVGGLRFSDYTVVVQAALLGQGVALGWMNVVSHLLARGDLVPAGPLARTGRTCELITERNPQSPVVFEICDWIAAQFASDMERLETLYPGLDPAWQAAGSSGSDMPVVAVRRVQG